MIEIDTGAPDAIHGTCECCGRQFWILPAQGVLVHEIPYCVDFQILDAVEFIRSNNEAKIKKMPRA